jgi:hypothetical protein
VTILQTDNGVMEQIQLLEPVAHAPGHGFSHRPLTFRELTKARTDPQYREQVADELAAARTDPAARKERILRFVNHARHESRDT